MRTLFCTLAVSVVLMTPLARATETNGPAETQEKWAGVDETVVEKFAEEAGRPARDPVINVGEGDMLLFMFLLAGAVGGFIMGYACRSLFGKAPAADQQPHSEPRK